MIINVPNLMIFWGVSINKPMCEKILFFGINGKAVCSEFKITNEATNVLHDTYTEYYQTIIKWEMYCLFVWQTSNAKIARRNIPNIYKFYHWVLDYQI